MHARENLQFLVMLYSRSLRCHSQDLPGVTRTHSYCGMKGEAQFAKCDLFIKCFEETESIGDWAVCMETKVRPQP